MNKSIELKKKKLKNFSSNLINLAKKNNKVKPIQDAFKDVPTSEEDHKGKLSYFDK